MSLTSAKIENGNVLVTVPPTRSDVLHACDVMEDAAIAYGFNNIPKTHPKVNTIAAELPVNKLTDLLRREVAFAGYTEALNFSLVRMQLLSALFPMAPLPPY
jgi:phenylalanyl-tRNA synthetase beta chain